MEIQELEKYLHENLSKKRWKHVLNVRGYAVKMADKYGVNPKKAELAALLHDITKELKFDNQLQMITKSDIITDDIILKSKPLYHAVTGAIYAKETFGVGDVDVLNAIQYHTTARRGMSKLEKIVYISDAVSSDREYSEVERFRELSFVDLDLCLTQILKHTIRYLVKDECLIPSDTMDAYNELIIKQEGVCF